MNRKGFTLIELLAVIVILAIILAIAIPAVAGIISSTKRNTLREDAEMVLRAVEFKKVTNPDYDATTINKGNIHDELGINGLNYDAIAITNDGVITITGSGKWEGLTATGTKNNIVVAATGEEPEPEPEPEEIVMVMEVSPSVTQAGGSVTVSTSPDPGMSDLSGIAGAEFTLTLACVSGGCSVGDVTTVDTSVLDENGMGTSTFNIPEGTSSGTYQIAMTLLGVEAAHENITVEN